MCSSSYMLFAGLMYVQGGVDCHCPTVKCVNEATKSCWLHTNKFQRLSEYNCWKDSLTSYVLEYIPIHHMRLQKMKSNTVNVFLIFSQIRNTSWWMISEHFGQNHWTQNSFQRPSEWQELIKVNRWHMDLEMNSQLISQSKEKITEN